jgi:lactate dehydrogenase-like 2-hydroxyacid dehydrogenase
LDGAPAIWVIAGDTDGIDGAEEVAGAIVAPDTLERARAAGLNPRVVLAANDAHTLFEMLGDQVITGPTLTNVNDFRAILITSAIGSPTPWGKGNRATTEPSNDRSDISTNVFDVDARQAMKPEIVLNQKMMPSLEAVLDRDYIVRRIASRSDTVTLPAAACGRIRAIVTGGSTGASPELVEALPALEIITINGVGTDAVDLRHAKARGVRVTNTPDVLTDDVADMALALILATLRRICVGKRLVRAGRWGNAAIPLATKFTGKRLGILGLGRIGRAIAKRASGFDVAIAYTDQRAFDDVPYRFEPSLSALARDCDILVVAAAGGPASQGLVNREVLDALGPESILVNVARGSVVDEAALVEALREGRLGGAGLDVFEQEPQVPEALYCMEQVVLQPHQASATRETREAMGRIVLDNLAVQFAGRPPPTAIV